MAVAVLHLSTHDIRGGAGRAAFRLHQGLQQRAMSSEMLVDERHSKSPHINALSGRPLSRLWRKLRWRQLPLRFWRYWPTRPPGYGPFNGATFPSLSSVAGHLPACDIVNLHRVASMLDHADFFRQVSLPIVWTQHDMNGFSGGCAYSHDCRGYTKNCGRCPQLGSHRQEDASRAIWRQKHTAYRRLGSRQLHVVTPSHWMASKVGKSSLLGQFPLSVIPNAVDTDVFAPQDRGGARSALDIPSDAKVVLFSAASVKVRRKGMDLLMCALSQLSRGEDVHPLLVCLGSGSRRLDVDVPYRGLGHLSDDHHIALAYSAADVFVIASRQDNLPNTVLESMACGTPVVGFATGGIPDMVRPGVTGLLAPPGDADSLAVAISDLLGSSGRRRRLSQECRKIALTEYALPVQARRYAELYRRMLDKNQHTERTWSS